ncbi:putative oleoyl-[acyl-carrier-protein] hydrolase [Helianthus annuus]|uniref:Acyl-[acyl-carrier-protein] hydrolase n=1 Tax=Helianthus annuus TaxID=4232 RepID=A0A251UNI2_HELAN|nr:palmitoyl-acyl carrier protein thioesterase, chloroplastic [Helianthus annuus]KAF5805287.1 putative oleoyl-[acyl-carrier-protein] hydrolase [Helianthus annuus]KAJ0569765.1 putative oleoyl-[acyl-carrier-protein] hydrolase [Helianthus annuus]KAJ0584078.1 putative oleoyl-[acyl-carrier-protein] hydrolase [Helianthus annuus]KAJ0749745.1 putative oleoyl-[acyl-carrier-protein] hydrolase [Helianthus annuus]KAJ0918368.1 putative oleoyl-[acyl-carrier-protein] hydrolase [Helianthus annuus]
MVATTASASLFPVTWPKPHSGAGTFGKVGNEPGSVDMRGNKMKSVNSGGMQVKANSQAPTEVNGSKKRVINGLKTAENLISHAPRTVINQLPDWSVLLASITTIFLAAEKQWMMLDWMTKRPDLDPFGLGKIVQDGLGFRENFLIRSYEVGADRNASIETIMNHLQETALNHAKSVGLMGNGFGSTPEMFKRNLFWVVTKMHVIVDRYPTWGDVVQVDTWIARNGKNSMRRDWLVRDCNTGDILITASSNWVMMNKETRRLSKIPDEVRGEIEHLFVDAPPVVDDDCRKLPKLEETTADYVRKGLTPRWSDLDVNQHVNNVKYIDWVLESAPQVVEKYELASITLEYRRECRKDSVVKSLTSILGGSDDGDNGGIPDSNHVNCQHVLLSEGGGDGAPGGEIVKGRTEWRLKYI